jgi:hypothetical protein
VLFSLWSKKPISRRKSASNMSLRRVNDSLSATYNIFIGVNQ